MSNRQQLKPSEQHPLHIEKTAKRVIVRFGDAVIAESDRALTVHEASYPAALYIPRDDVDMTALERSTHKSYCPYKGEASYFTIATNGARSRDAVWTYEDPFEAVRAIKDYLAFYPDRVGAIIVA